MRSRPSNSPVPYRTLDALFFRTCGGDPALLEAARRVGLVVDSERGWYTLDELRIAIGLARNHCYPDLSPEEGERTLGRRWVSGMAQTAVGRVMAGIARVVGAERMLGRMGHYVRSGRSDIQVTSNIVAPGEWRIRVDDSRPMPHYGRGVLEGIVEVCGEDPQTWLIAEHPGGYELGVRWPAAPAASSWRPE